jgi:hypothetical protein
VTRSTSAGVISCPHCGQGVASDARTLSRSIFRRAGTRGFYSEASLPSASVIRVPAFAITAPLAGVRASGAHDRSRRDMLSIRIWRTEGAAMSLESIVEEIKAEIEKLNQVLRLLGGGAKTKVKRATAPRRKMSAAGRKRIAAAQRARWAKVRAAKK